MNYLTCLLSLRVVIALIIFASGADGCFVNRSSAQSPATPARVASIPIETAENQLLIKARVNGSEPMTFVLDSGAGSGLVLYFEAAQALQLKLQGRGKGSGGGEGTFETTTTKGVSLSLPGIELSNQTFVVFPPDKKLHVFGRVIAGVIGYTLFSRYVVEIDYYARVVNLYEPQLYQYSGPGESVPIKIASNVPFVRARIPSPGGKPRDGEFIVDTGADRFTVILNTAFVEANKLLAAAQKTVREPGAEGVGGEVKLLVGRLSTVQVGSFTLANPVVYFAQDRKGVFGSSEFSGVIGGELLRRFKVIFDYSRKRMILEPNASLADRFEFDMSGLRLRPEGADLKTLRVWRLVENSPATEIGIREGDLILAIDGQPVAELSLYQINKMFRQEGKEYLLDIVSGGEKKEVKLKLRVLV